MFIWKVSEALRDYLRKELEGVEVTLIFPEGKEDEDLMAHASRADVLVGWQPKQELLDACGRLKLLINPGAGVQHLKERFAYLKERGVVLVNGHGNAYFTAEHIVAMLLGVCNRLISHHQFMLEGKWRTGDKEAKSIPLRDRKIGLLGYGHVNKCVHRLLAGFGCSFSVLRRNPLAEVEQDLATPADFYGSERLADFLTVIDTLIIAVPSTAQTKGMIGTAELKLLGEPGIVINAGRGDVIVEKDLFDSLKAKTISQAAIDVWYNYKPEEDSEGRKRPYQYPFHELNNVLLSPHRAASPFDDVERYWDVAENIRRFANGNQDYLNEVDLTEGY